MNKFNKFNIISSWKRYLPFLLLIVAIICCDIAIADVGNQNRYDSDYSGDSGYDSDSDSGDGGALVGLLLGLLISHPKVGIPILILLVIFYFIMKRKSKNTNKNERVNNQAALENTPDSSAEVAVQIQTIDPAFSSDKFIGFAREVFMTIQQAWTAKDWKPIRPFESETLFNTHKQQLDEYIRLGKTNVVEKIAIKHCSLHSFRQDGDKEVLTVWLNAVMRDYVIDDTTKKVLESDPNRDWYMRYEMVFNRKAGLKTDPSKKGNTITNCPNCGAPTEITSSGQCAYCGSVVTNGEHDWVLTDIHSRN